MPEFLHVIKEEKLERGWDQPNFVYEYGDTHVDYLSFGVAIILYPNIEEKIHI